jgi:nucleoside-diphosphate-sugar epimerase
MAPKPVLLTGATGFVGANLARRLLGDGHEVHVLVRPGRDQWRLEEIRQALVVHEVDLAVAEAVHKAVAQTNPEWVFHLAAYGAYPTQDDLGQAVQTNVMGTLNLVRACCERGVSAIVSAGSSSEYGLKDHAPLESELLEPNSDYAATKASATIISSHLARSRGVPLTTLRLYSVYGPFEEPSRLIPALVLCGLRSTLPPLVSPDVARDFVYVDDVIDAFVLAAKQPHGGDGRVYNIATGMQTTVRQAVDAIRHLLPIEADARWGSMPDRKWDTNVWVGDSGLIRGELGWQPRSFDEGLRLTVEWFVAEPTVRRFYEARRGEA